MKRHSKPAAAIVLASTQVDAMLAALITREVKCSTFLMYPIFSVEVFGKMSLVSHKFITVVALCLTERSSHKSSKKKQNLLPLSQMTDILQG